MAHRKRNARAGVSAGTFLFAFFDCLTAQIQPCWYRDSPASLPSCFLTWRSCWAEFLNRFAEGDGISSRHLVLQGLRSLKAAKPFRFIGKEIERKAQEGEDIRGTSVLGLIVPVSYRTCNWEISRRQACPTPPLARGWRRRWRNWSSLREFQALNRPI